MEHPCHPYLESTIVLSDNLGPCEYLVVCASGVKHISMKGISYQFCILHMSIVTISQFLKSYCLLSFDSVVPTMMDVISFPLQDSKVDLTEEVGTKYLKFGILLLEDQTGARISAMERKLAKNAQDINYRVFQEWLQGNGRKPVPG